MQHIEATGVGDVLLKGAGKTEKEDVGMTGFMTLDVYDKDGKLKAHRESEQHNMITDAGKAIMSGLLLSDVGGIAFHYIAIGIGTAAAAHTDTALGSEITTFGGARKAGTGSQTQTTYANDTSVITTTFTFTTGASFVITEAGVFNASSGVTMLCRQVFAAVNVGDTDTLALTWKIVFSAAT